MTFKSEVATALRRLGAATLTFLTSIVMALVLVGSGLLLEFIIGVFIGRETVAFGIVEVILNVTLVGCALVWSVTGAFVVTMEAIVSAWAFFRRFRE